LVLLLLLMVDDLENICKNVAGKSAEVMLRLIV